MCGAPLESRRDHYCGTCRELALIRRRKASSAHWAAWRDAHPDRVRELARRRDVNRKSTTERGYGAEHQRLRREWAKKVAAGGVSCARCGLPIEPGTRWDLAHDPMDRSRYWGAEHARCNRGWNRIGNPEAPEPATNPYKPSRTTRERGLGGDHQRLRNQILPYAYGTACPMCGEVMSADQSLDLDHVVPRAVGGDGPVRIVHTSCNRSEGAKFGNRLRAVRSRW